MAITASTLTVSTAVGIKVTKTVPEKQLLKATQARRASYERVFPPPMTQSSELSTECHVWSHFISVLYRSSTDDRMSCVVSLYLSFVPKWYRRQNVMCGLTLSQFCTEVVPTTECHVWSHFISVLYRSGTDNRMSRVVSLYLSFVSKSYQ